MRVLLDTNVWISYLLTRSSQSTVRQVVQTCILGDIELVVPEELMAELRTSAAYPHLAPRIRPDEVELLVQQLRLVAIIPPSLLEELAPYSRDLKDDYMVAYALAHQVDFLVTGDKDLLVLEAVEQLRIVTPAGMRRLLEDARGG